MGSFFTVFKKELQDHFNSWQVVFAFLVVLMPCIYYIWLAAGSLKQSVTSESYFAFIPLFTAQVADIPLLPSSFLELDRIFIAGSGYYPGYGCHQQRKE